MDGVEGTINDSNSTARGTGPAPAVGDLGARLKAEALRLGFDQVGIAPAVTPPGYPSYLRWLEAGHAAGMEYLHRQAPGRAGPSALLEGVRSVVMVSVVYGDGKGRDAAAEHKADAESGNGAAGALRGKISRYARGGDYHRAVWDRLNALLAWLKAERPGASGRAVSDTAPLLERDFARLAGLGWIGKNTLLIDRKLGSYTFLGALLTDVELTYDPPHETSHCGTCTRCLDACPTSAFPAPYQLDARRCISYWTIEHRGAVVDEAAEALHGWVFGCDICQEVCPWNRKAPPGRMPELAPRPEWDAPNLIEWLSEGPSGWRGRLKGTALERTKRAGLLRNAALVLGSRRRPEAVPALAARLNDADENPIVRAAAAWALGRIASAEAVAALSDQRDHPGADATVGAAVAAALRAVEERRGGADGPDPT